MNIIKKFTKFKLYCILYWNLMFKKHEESPTFIYEDDDEDFNSRR